MGIGKAVPANVFPQDSYPDYYFEISNSNHMSELKAKFANICAKTAIEKRHFCISDKLLRSSPSITAFDAPSITLRQELADEAVPRLGAEAARNAIADWGRPASSITHLVLSTSGSGRGPGADSELVRLLGLPTSTKRLMMYQAGCYGGCAAMRVAKDLAENNPGARVLVVASEVTALWLRGPSDSHVGNLVGQAMFGDAAAALVVGSVPGAGERALFELVRTSQELVPSTGEAIVSRVREEGIVFAVRRDVPHHVSSHAERLVARALREAGEQELDRNEEVFWAVHPGGREILDRLDRALGLRDHKLAASRSVMRQYGNTRGSCVLLVLDEMRRRSEERGMRTAGEGLRWGILVAFGPGVTVETILLRAPPLTN